MTTVMSLATDGVDGRVRLGHPERQLEVRGELARHADDAHRVGAVGRDRQLEDHVVEAEDDADVVAELARRRRAR